MNQNQVNEDSSLDTLARELQKEMAVEMLRLNSELTRVQKLFFDLTSSVTSQKLWSVRMILSTLSKTRYALQQSLEQFNQHSPTSST